MVGREKTGRNPWLQLCLNQTHLAFIHPIWKLRLRFCLTNGFLCFTKCLNTTDYFSDDQTTVQRGEEMCLGCTATHLRMWGSAELSHSSSEILPFLLPGAALKWALGNTAPCGFGCRKVSILLESELTLRVTQHPLRGLDLWTWPSMSQNWSHTVGRKFPLQTRRKKCPI